MATGVLGLRFVLSAVFVSAGAVKLPRLAEFETALRHYQLLPTTVVGPVARAVALAELGAGVALALGFGTTVAAGAISVLLVVFAGSVGINLARGRLFDCGCGITAGPRVISWTLVAQDLGLAAMAGTVAAFAPRVFALDQLLFGRSGPPTRDALAAPIIAALLLVVAALTRQTLVVGRLIR